MAKGNQNGTEQFLISVPLPEETDSYTVISHQEIIEKVENELNNASLEIIDVDYTYSYGGDVALAKVYIKSVVDADMGMLFTWQNSYNKKVKFSCAIGAYIHENKASLIGTEGLSWIRKHTGDANDEAYQVIESLIDMADVHFTKVIAEKERMKAMQLDTEGYGRVMGALYFEHSLVTPNQASIVKKEREKPLHTYSDKNTLWGLYKLLMYGIENADITKWQQSQQKLHHLIMAEYAIAVENMTTSDSLTEIHQESDLEYQERVVAIENEMEEPLAPNELRETGPPTQEEMTEVLEEIVTEEIGELIQEEIMNHKGNAIPIVDDRQEWADKVLAEDNTEEDHVGPPEMYAGETVVLEANKDGEPLVSAKFQEFDFTDESVVEVDEDELVEDPIKLAGEITGISNDVEENEVGVELEEEEIIETISNEGFEELDVAPQISKEDCCIEGSHMASVDDNGFCNNCGEQEACTTESEDVQEEFEQAKDQEVNESEVEVEEVDFMALANKYTADELEEPVPIIAPAEITLPPLEKKMVEEGKDAVKKIIEATGVPASMLGTKEEESFLDIQEHEGLTVPEGLIENSAVVEKKMILLYGSVRPYNLEQCGDQINVTIEDTFESFYVNV